MLKWVRRSSNLLYNENNNLWIRTKHVFSVQYVLMYGPEHTLGVFSTLSNAKAAAELLC